MNRLLRNIAWLVVGLGTALPALAADQFINVLTGGTSGVYYPLGVALANDIGKAMPGVKTSVQATKASVENLNLLQAGRGEIAFTLGDSLSDAWKGNEEAGFKTPLKKLRGIAAIYPNYIQIVARADAGIKTLADLKGKRISVGAPKSGTELNARAILAAAGITLQGLREGRVPAVRRIGRADEEPPARRHAAVGGPRRVRAARPRDVGRHRRRPDSRRRRSRRPTIPAYLPATIPANTYRGQTADVPAAAVQNYLVTHDGVSNDTVYGMTKALWTEPRPARRRALGGQGDRSQARARRHAGAAASGRREVLQGSRPHQVTRGRGRADDCHA